jgi:hypothetical protein
MARNALQTEIKIQILRVQIRQLADRNSNGDGFWERREFPALLGVI